MALPISDGITGITGLHCRTSFNTNAASVDGNAQITVGLDAGEAGVEGYTMFGNLYTLDQRIGNPSISPSSGETSVNFYCSDNGFIGGLEMSHSSEGLLDFFHPYCMPFPL